MMAKKRKTIAHREKARTDKVRESVAGYSPTLAVLYGQFVDSVYQMYEKYPGNPTPPALALPAGYKLIAWVQMMDFIIVGGDWTFYGLIAQSTTDENNFVLAIRGTENLEEWFDDLTSTVLVPWENFGNVGYGFSRIYQTLRVVYAETLGSTSATHSFEPTSTFAHQVAAAVQRHAANVTASSVAVTGHSLGAALATLYMAHTARNGLLSTPLICTFASPRVGDPVFAANFNQLGITSWRIINELDVVPKLPFLGFEHVQTVYSYNSGFSVIFSLGCLHSLTTYLHLLDLTQQLSDECRWPPMVAATAPLRRRVRPTKKAVALSAQAEKDIAVSVPQDSDATINITIKIGRTEEA